MQPVGVVGSGSFGTTIAKLLAVNTDVLVYTRKAEVLTSINEQHEHMGYALSERIRATTSLEELTEQCTLLFPVVPSASFRNAIRDLSPHLHPYHILIHGTKGFDFTPGAGDPDQQLTREEVHTMSEVILQETDIVRVGCLSGPNLASEILAGQPAATVIASSYREVIDLGKEFLRSPGFHVFGSGDILGAELGGALKNIIAIGAGVLHGKGLGHNIHALLLTRGLSEMITIGQAMGASARAFLGTAGIGDLIATASSTDSRNFSFGELLAQGKTRREITGEMAELAEGERTLRIAHRLATYYRIKVPITSMLYKVVFEDFDIDRAIQFLMAYPFEEDTSFV